MDHFKNYIKLTFVDAIAYFVIALVLLILDNVKNIIKVLTGLNSQDSTQFLGDLLSPIYSLKDSILDIFSPKIVEVFLWSTIGCVLVIVAFWIALAIENLFNEKTTLSYVSNKKLKQKEILTFLTRLFIRITAFFVAVILFINFVFKLFPTLSSNFLKVFSNTNFYNIIGAFLAVFAVGLVIYLLVVCVRFILLKPRIL